MWRKIFLAGLGLACCMQGSAQQFEAASIKPVPATVDASNGPGFYGSRGGPGTQEPTHYQCAFCEVTDLLSKAYNIPEYRIVGAKDLLKGRFNLVAVMAPQTNREEFRIMLQKLLVERFGLKIHQDKRQMNSYRLLVARGGVKLKPHVEGAPEEKSGKENAQVGNHYKTAATTADFARMLEGRMGTPVVDGTGLTEKYDFNFSWAFDDVDFEEKSHSDLPTLRSAMQEIGLRLEGHKEDVGVIVVDEVAKSPTSD